MVMMMVIMGWLFLSTGLLMIVWRVRWWTHFARWARRLFGLLTMRCGKWLGSLFHFAVFSLYPDGNARAGTRARMTVQVCVKIVFASF